MRKNFHKIPFFIVINHHFSIYLRVQYIAKNNQNSTKTFSICHFGFREPSNRITVSLQLASSRHFTQLRAVSSDVYRNVYICIHVIRNVSASRVPVTSSQLNNFWKHFIRTIPSSFCSVFIQCLRLFCIIFAFANVDNERTIYEHRTKKTQNFCCIFFLHCQLFLFVFDIFLFAYIVNGLFEKAINLAAGFLR